MGASDKFSHARIEHNIIRANSATGDHGPGGGVFGCDGIINNNTIFGNFAGYGGGLAWCDGTIQNNVIRANSAEKDGGGLSHCHGTISGNMISGNSANSGGGLYSCDGVVQNNVMWDNSVRGYGGGLGECDATIQNNVISANQAGWYGGALWRCHGTIQNNTIVGNVADFGSAIYSSEGTIRSCIIWGNTSAHGGQLCDWKTLTHSCIEGWLGLEEWNFGFYPYFVDLSGGDFHLKSWSPCTDAGDPMSPFSEEADPNGERVNMGAYGNTPEATSKSPDADQDGLPDDWEIEFFGDLAQESSSDPDGDNLSNIEEYLRGLNPAARWRLWYADASAPPSGDGRSWETAFRKIQEGIDGASERDTIIVAPAVYVENIHFHGKNVRLTSADPFDSEIVASTAIDGNRLGSVVTFSGTENETCLLAGFTIRNGQAESGAGIQGGGWETYTHATIRNNVIIDNVALGEHASGGGVASCHGLIENNVIADNSAKGNYGSGGGLTYCNGLIQNNTITDNWAASDAGALSRCAGTIGNCIISGNRSRMRAQLYESSEPTYCCIEDWIGGGEGNIMFHPCFVDPKNGDYHLQPWSPCIDAGDPGSLFAREPEPNGGRVNMGAYGNTAQAASRSPDTDFDSLADDW